MTAYPIPRPVSGDVIDLVLDDHRLFESLMREMRDSSSDRVAAREAFAAVLVAHGEAEEDKVYPRLRRKQAITADEEEHGEEEHAEINEALLAFLQAKGTDTQKFQDALEAVAEVLNHHIGEEELTILNPAREDASEELRQELGKTWSAKRNELLEAEAGSIEQVEGIVKQAYTDGLLPNDDQPE